jgi:hypothetical protein
LWHGHCPAADDFTVVEDDPTHNETKLRHSWENLPIDVGSEKGHMALRMAHSHRLTPG